MKTDLDTKLREILQEWDNLGWSSSIGVESAMIAQIKTAFEEAGWRDMRSDNQAVKYGGYLSGAEWLERFKEELIGEYLMPRDDSDKLHNRMRDLALEAAKRASGVKDEN